jgi:hypothetical protein
VDSLTQALEYLQRPMPGQGWLDFIEADQEEERQGWGAPRKVYQVEF